MSTEADAGEPQHDMLRGLALLREGVEMMQAASPAWSLSTGAIRSALVDLDRELKRAEASRLALVRESVAREEGPHRGRETRRLLVRRCHATAARAHGDVANAGVVDPDAGQLPRLGQALAYGDIGREHVDVARRCLERIPSALAREHALVIDQTLTAHARDWNPRDSATLAEHVLSRIAPDAGDRYDPNALDRRALHTGTDSTGMLVLHGQLDPAAGAKFTAVLERLSSPDSQLGSPPDPCSHDDDGDQTSLPVPDLRTGAQRRADAFSRMVDLAAEHLALDPDTGRPRAARAVPRIVIHATPEQLAGTRGDQSPGPNGGGAATLENGSLLSHGTLVRLSCDAVVDRVLLSPAGQILQMSTIGRLATDAQTTALASRDGGCVWPGCSAPPCVCDAHHVVWWSRGGPTTTDNLCLLCPSHHTEIHTERWQITMRDGIPWFLPPEHLDPHRQPLRNTLRDAVQRARAVGDQLRLEFRRQETASPGPRDRDGPGDLDEPDEPDGTPEPHEPHGPQGPVTSDGR